MQEGGTLVTLLRIDGEKKQTTVPRQARRSRVLIARDVSVFSLAAIYQLHFGTAHAYYIFMWAGKSTSRLYILNFRSLFLSRFKVGLSGRIGFFGQLIARPRSMPDTGIVSSP
jgi:hypothetical protein